MRTCTHNNLPAFIGLRTLQLGLFSQRLLTSAEIPPNVALAKRPQCRFQLSFFSFFLALRLVSLRHLKEADMWREDDERERRKLTRVICSGLSSRGDGLDRK